MFDRCLSTSVCNRAGGVLIGDKKGFHPSIYKTFNKNTSGKFYLRLVYSLISSLSTVLNIQDYTILFTDESKMVAGVKETVLSIIDNQTLLATQKEILVKITTVQFDTTVKKYRNYRKKMFGKITVINSERSDECIDFTMIITSRNNAPISNYGGGFRCKSEYPWCIIEFEFIRNMSKLRKFAMSIKFKICLALSKYLEILYNVPHMMWRLKIAITFVMVLWKDSHPLILCDEYVNDVLGYYTHSSILTLPVTDDSQINTIDIQTWISGNLLSDR
ncbi:hypothetical protein AGLY_013486 [Aphis glycines]|uniref:Uncharacterized protein n=1 Tax=Aphis glycines TaxID=307491 RepID=A0A6G0T6G3_APHGL|nr:hypothetical protein AGLY_013486 [Aphis glycines]